MKIILSVLMSTSAFADLFPKDLLGVGSQLHFTRDVEFGRSRTKTFCEGKTNPLPLLWLGHCCTIERGAPIARAKRVTMRAEVLRTVNFVNWRRTRIMIDAPTETSVRCRSHRLSGTYLVKAFGDLIRIDRVVAPLSAPTGDVLEF